MNANSTDQRNKPLIGIVVNNQDPLLLRRVQCKIEGLIETDDEESLPWFRPKTSGLGSRSDYGNFDEVPEVNTTVCIEIPDGDIRNAIYSAMPDTAVDASQKRVFGEDYPATYGTCDAKGNIQRTNKKRGYSEELTHAGIYCQKDKDGNLHVHIPNNVIIHIGGNFLMQVDRSMFVKVLQMLGLAAGKDIGIAGKNVEVIAEGQFAVDAESADLANGMRFGVKDALESLLPDAVKEKDKRYQEMLTLQKMVGKSGKLADESIQATRKALLGTRDS